MALKFLNSWTIYPVYLVLLLQVCGDLAARETEVIPPLGSVPSEEEAKIENFGQPKAQCTQGLFHTKPEFSDGSIFKPPFGPILETVYGITRATYCAGVGLVADPILGVISQEEFCDCDCEYGHGASGYEFCKKTNPDIPCKCIYTEEDLLEAQKHSLGGPISNSKELQGSAQLQSNNSAFLKRTINGTSELLAQPGNDRAGVCKAIFGGIVVKFTCSPINDGGNPFYTVGDNKIFPEDVCSIDCFFIHGARKAPGPYGQCCEKNGATRCVCLY